MDRNMYYLKIEKKTEVKVIALGDNFNIICKNEENKDIFLSRLKLKKIHESNEYGLEYKYLITPPRNDLFSNGAQALILTDMGEDESRWIIEPNGNQCPLDSFFRG